MLEEACGCQSWHQYVECCKECLHVFGSCHNGVLDIFTRRRALLGDLLQILVLSDEMINKQLEVSFIYLDLQSLEIS